jgi:hypothetical protein
MFPKEFFFPKLRLIQFMKEKTSHYGNYGKKQYTSTPLLKKVIIAIQMKMLIIIIIRS